MTKAKGGDGAAKRRRRRKSAKELAKDAARAEWKQTAFALRLIRQSARKHQQYDQATQRASSQAAGEPGGPPSGQEDRRGCSSAGESGRPCRAQSRPLTGVEGGKARCAWRRRVRAWLRVAGGREDDKRPRLNSPPN